MDKTTLSVAIKEEALRLGFAACGIAKADRVSAEAEEELRSWLRDGREADMTWMNNYVDKRLDPRLLMPGLKSIVSVAMNYAPAKTLPADQPQIAAYALGHDYHDVVKERLRQLAAFVTESLSSLPPSPGGRGSDYRDKQFPDSPTNVTAPLPRGEGLVVRLFVDTGPVLERYWAMQAGLGWIGRNRQLIIPHAGSMFFLGELFLPIELDYDTPMESRCGRCTRCIDACPTHALGTPSTGASSGEHGKADSPSHSEERARGRGLGGEAFDARRCLSYQLIENRGELSEEAKATMGNTFYGCDRCQQACPWNRFATPNTTPELQPREELLAMTAERWEHLTQEEYQRLFKGSAVKRAKYVGLKRNIEAMLEGEAQT